MNEGNGAVRDQAQPLRELVEQRARHMKIITIASGKGGVGKSSLSVNLAIALSELGMRVLVIDADFGLANIDVMLGVNSRYNLSHLLRGEKTLQQIIQEGHRGVRFISGGSGVYELLSMDEARLHGIMRSLMNLRNPADIVLFDSGAGISENVLQLAQASTETIVVTTPEPTAILDAYALIKTLVKRDSSQVIRLLMNKGESKKESEAAAEGFQKVIRRHLGVDIESIGNIPYDHSMTKSIKQQTPIIVSHPGGQTAREIHAVAKALLNLPARDVPQGRFARLLARVFGG